MNYGTIFEPTAAEPTVPDVLTDKRNELRTPASVRTVLTEDQAKRIEPYIYYFPQNAIETPKVVPQGYADAGKPAPDLNKFVTDKDVEGIASHINKNLPDFEERAGEKFPSSQDYVKTIAASMIDYADADSNPTWAPSYRGVDSYPFLTEIAERYEWIGQKTDNPIKIATELYIEIWNPSQKTITGDVSFENINRVKLKIPPATEHVFTNASYNISNVTLLPNEYKVLKLGEKDYTFAQGAALADEMDFIDVCEIKPYPQTSPNGFELKWNGKIVDSPLGGLQRSEGLLKHKDRKWKGNSAPILDFSYGQRGDPRASYYINNWVYAGNYDKKSNWGGRMKTTTSNPDYNEVRITDWPDGGSNSTEGDPSGTDNRRPGPDFIRNFNMSHYKDYLTPEQDYAPAVISNTGKYTSLAELGHIFDPAQRINMSEEDSSSFEKNRISTRSHLDMIPGGGITLAIGRAEFKALDVEGQRASQLLDLFSIAEDTSGTPTERGSKINVNTASREVLRTLSTGIELDADPLFPELALKKDSEIGDLLADSIIKQRAIAPLRSLSDFNEIEQTITIDDVTKETNFFGELENLSGSKSDEPQIRVLNDAGREEMFGQIMEMVTFGSKDFRIVVRGEALNPDGKVIGRSAKEYIYTVEPSRDPVTKHIIPDAPVKLTKRYEKVY